MYKEKKVEYRIQKPHFDSIFYLNKAKGIDSNMQITPFSLLMSVIWSSALAIFNYFCRKKHFFIRQLGITNILFLYLFSIVRMIIPYEFSFTRVIPSGEVFSNLCRDTSIHKIGASQISIKKRFGANPRNKMRFRRHR